MDDNFIEKQLDQIKESDRILVRNHLKTHPEEINFVNLLLENQEFDPSDRSYSSWLKFNLTAVERGSIFINELENEIGSIKGLKILDVGAGSGGNSIAFHNHGCEVTALEPDETRIKWLNSRLLGHKIIIQVKTKPIEDEAITDNYDIIYCNAVLEHVADWRKFLNSLVAIKPKFIYLSWPNKFSPLEIYSDSHYALFGMSFLIGRLKPLQKYYLKLFGIKRNAWVTTIPTLFSLKIYLKYANAEYRIRYLDPLSFNKLITGGNINYAPARFALNIFKLLRIPIVIQAKTARFFYKNYSILLEKHSDPIICA